MSRPGDERDPVWSPDGTALIFTSDRTGFRTLFRKSLVNNQPETPLLATGKEVIPEAVTPDGKAIVYVKLQGIPVGFVWRLDGSAAPQPILEAD